MKRSRVAFLSLSEIEDRIARLESIYGMSTAEFLAKKEPVPEDDALQWDSYLAQRRALKQHYQTVRSTYLPDAEGEFQESSDQTDLDLAA